MRVISRKKASRSSIRSSVSCLFWREKNGRKSSGMPSACVQLTQKMQQRPQHLDFQPLYALNRVRPVAATPLRNASPETEPRKIPRNMSPIWARFLSRVRRKCGEDWGVKARCKIRGRVVLVVFFLYFFVVQSARESCWVLTARPSSATLWGFLLLCTCHKKNP